LKEAPFVSGANSSAEDGKSRSAVQKRRDMLKDIESDEDLINIETIHDAVWKHL
jgi:biotin operon repressor